MSNTAVTVPNTFANLSGTVQLALLDQNFTPVANALNSLAQYSNYFLDTSGAANAITVTVASPLTFGYTAGIQLQVKIANTNTSGTVVINVNALGNVNVKNPDGSNPGIGQLKVGGVYTLQYDGLNFQIIGAASVSGTTGLFADGSAGSPAISFQSDTALGLYKAGTDILGITTAGTQRITINASGLTTLNAPTTGQAIVVNGAASNSFGTWINSNASGFGALTFQNDTGKQLTFGVGGSTGGGWSQNQPAVGTTTNDSLVLGTNSVVRVTISATGNTSATTLSASGNVVPASGQTIDLQYSAGGFVTAYDHTGNAGQPLTLRGSTITLATGSAVNQTGLSQASTGAVSIPAPTSGDALTVVGASGGNTAKLTGSSSTGLSFGLGILAGTNSSDAALRVFNQSGGTQQFLVRGDGLVQAVDQGGTLQDVGWRGTPINSQGSNYTLVIADRGKTVWATATETITVPPSIFSGGDVITIINSGSTTTTIAQGAGVSIFWAGNGTTSGNRTLTGIGICTLLCVSGNNFYISGAGLT